MSATLWEGRSERIRWKSAVARLRAEPYSGLASRRIRADPVKVPNPAEPTWCVAKGEGSEADPVGFRTELGRAKAGVQNEAFVSRRL